MIADPDEPGYRYPQPGERLWHEPWQQWVEVVPEVARDVADEVPVRLRAGGSLAIVKLRSLEERPA